MITEERRQVLIQEAKRELKIGDIIKFGMKYANTVFVTGREDIAKNIIE